MKTFMYYNDDGTKYVGTDGEQSLVMEWEKNTNQPDADTNTGAPRLRM